MTQREVRDSDGTNWSCVQAYAGLSNSSASEVAKAAAGAEGTCTVVCTPSGGAQTVRLELPTNWTEALKDKELVQQIEKARASTAQNQ